MSNRIKKRANYPQYLLVKCVALDDQWECEYDRTPRFVTSDIDEAFSKKYRGDAIYGITATGEVVHLRDPQD